MAAVFAFDSGNGLGAANFVSSLETFVWLVVFWWWRERFCFVAPFCLEEISRAAICRVTEPIVAIAFQVEQCLSAKLDEHRNQPARDRATFALSGYVRSRYCMYCTVSFHMRLSVLR